MRDTPPCRWRQWRVTLVQRPSDPQTTRFVRRSRSGAAELDHSYEERRGPDGIRHELVARVRREIENGTYDTEEKWLLAEERLLDRVAGAV